MDVEEQGGVREAVAVFHKVDDLQAAIDELLSSGFDRAELSLLASDRAVAAKLGNVTFREAELEDDPTVPRGVYVSPAAMGAAEGGLVGALAYVGGMASAGLIALAGGPIAAIVLGAVLAGGAGGLLGTGLAELVGHRRATYFQEQLDRGGLLLWVRTWDTPREQKAVEILGHHSASDVHVHEFPNPNAASPHAQMN
jgi:outer membrane lipoprotein SlyB